MVSSFQTVVPSHSPRSNLVHAMSQADSIRRGSGYSKSINVSGLPHITTFINIANRHEHAYNSISVVENALKSGEVKIIVNKHTAIAARVFVDYRPERSRGKSWAQTHSWKLEKRRMRTCVDLEWHRLIEPIKHA